MTDEKFNNNKIFLLDKNHPAIKARDANTAIKNLLFLAILKTMQNKLLTKNNVKTNHIGIVLGVDLPAKKTQ